MPTARSHGPHADRGGGPARVNAPRIVLDTNVWLDLLHFHDPATAALDVALRGRRVVAVIDEACRAEFLRVLGYRALALDEAQRQGLSAALDTRCERVQVTASPAGLPRCRDRDDQKFLELAHAAGAHWLVSRDSEVLALARRAARDGLFAIVTPQQWAARATLQPAG